MKKIFIKDERLREIHHDLSIKISKMLLDGTIKGFYTIKESTKGFKDGIYFGWEVTDYEDGWKIEPDSRFEVVIEKSDDHYCATCEQLFTENVICPLMVCDFTVEGVLKRFVKELKAQAKTLCVRGKAIEGKLAESIYMEYKD